MYEPILYEEGKNVLGTQPSFNKGNKSALGIFDSLRLEMTKTCVLKTNREILQLELRMLLIR